MLSTNAFSIDEVLMLGKKLYNATGSTFKVREIIKRGNKQPTLICYKKADVQMFFDY